jgi:hypothetical protein
MTKLEFYEKLEEVKKRLPVGIYPLYLKAYPKEINFSRVKNTIAGKIHDEKILRNLEKLADAVENVKQ